MIGSILRVDLSTGQISTEKAAAEDMEAYLGGQGVAAAMFIREVAPDVDPYNAENRLIFSVGPFCGTKVPFCGRHFILGKSPLTGLIGEASAGGFFGKELQAAGFDFVIIKGKSQTPVYLWIDNGAASLKPAEDLWGKGTEETETILKAQLGDEKIRIASIGPAGENLVRYAAIINEKGHAAGRCGLGAVMGDKKLKAIALRGNQEAKVQDEEVFTKALTRLRQLTKDSLFAQVMGESGTPLHLDTMVTVGDFTAQNWLLPRWKGTNKLGAKAIQTRGEIKKYACYGCPVACKKLLQYEGNWVKMPEYETLAMMGTNLLVDDLECLIKWNILLNDLGVDSISLGGCLGGFLEAAARNLLDVDLKALGFTEDPSNPETYQVWGAKNAIENLISLVVRREGIGDDLADGIKRFCAKKNLPEELSIHGKGLELPAHEPRANNMTALDYATTPRGAYHCYEPCLISFNMNLKKELGITEIIDRFGSDMKVIQAVKNIQDAGEAFSASGGCIFGFWFIDELTPWVEALNGITGRHYSVESWMQAGERIFNMKRSYNVDCGISRKDDAFGTRFFTPFEKGGCRGKIPPLDALLSKYYELRGWNIDGKPPS